MTLSLSLDSLLSQINSMAATITGIRHAYNYDEWPDAPPGLFNKNQAMHLTGYPEEGDGWRYRMLGIDMDEFEVSVPMYTVVVAAAQVKRSRNWTAQYLDSYAAKFAAAPTLSGSIAAGSAVYTGGRVVRGIPDWDGYAGFYILRHTLEVHVKGHVSRS